MFEKPSQISMLISIFVDNHPSVSIYHLPGAQADNNIHDYVRFRYHHQRTGQIPRRPPMGAIPRFKKSGGGHFH